jgi:ketosteroid isomerase-like protein
MEKNEKLKLIKKYISSYNAFDIDGMLSVLDPDIEFRNISNSEETAKVAGIEAFQNLAEQSNALFSSREQKIDEIENQDLKTIVNVSYSGILAVDLPNGLNAGESINLKGISEFQFNNGKISSIIDKS